MAGSTAGALDVTNKQLPKGSVVLTYKQPGTQVSVAANQRKPQPDIHTLKNITNVWPVSSFLPPQLRVAVLWLQSVE